VFRPIHYTILFVVMCFVSIWVCVVINADVTDNSSRYLHSGPRLVYITCPIVGKYCKHIINS